MSNDVIMVILQFGLFLIALLSFVVILIEKIKK